MKNILKSFTLKIDTTQVYDTIQFAHNISTSDQVDLDFFDDNFEEFSVEDWSGRNKDKRNITL